MKVLITGITGFVGSHMAEYILQNNLGEVYGTVRWRSPRDNIKHLEKDLNLVECDLQDSTAVDRLLKTVKPDRIFHLAAQSFVPTSWVCPKETMDMNIQSELNLFEAVRKMELSTRIQIACSSEEYGLVLPDEVPIKETNPLRPLSPYGVSKIAQDFLGYQYAKSYKMHIVRTRAFNHTGPRRGEVFVTSDFAKQVAEMETGLRPPELFVGNLAAIRDFTDVRDMVRAYWLSLESCEPGEVYNIASGKGIAIQEIVVFYRSHAKCDFSVIPDPARQRPSDVPILVGDATKFIQATGWEPQIPLEQTLDDILNYWREKVGAKKPF